MEESRFLAVAELGRALQSFGATCEQASMATGEFFRGAREVFGPRLSFAATVLAALQHGGLTSAMLADEVGWSRRKLDGVLKYPTPKRLEVVQALTRLGVW